MDFFSELIVGEGGGDNIHRSPTSDQLHYFPENQYFRKKIVSTYKIAL